MDVASLGIKVESNGVKTAGNRLDSFSKSAGHAEKATLSLSKVAAALATAFATIKAAQLVKDSIQMAARYETLGVVMRVVGNNVGYTAAEMEKFAEGLQKTGISMSESRLNMTRMAQANIDLAQSSKLARIAQDAAVIGNINSSEAFTKMIRSIQSGLLVELKTIGINVRFEESYAKLAAQLGKTTKELTEQERTQARVNSVIEAGANISGVYENAMNTVGKQVLSLKRYHDDLRTVAGEVFGPTTIFAVKAYTDLLKSAQEELKALKATGQLDAWALDMATGVIGAIDVMIVGFGSLKQSLYAIRATFGIVAKGYGELRTQFAEADLRQAEAKLDSVETALKSKFQTFMFGGRELLERQREELLLEKATIKERIDGYGIIKEAGDMMAADNVANFDKQGAATDELRAKIEKLKQSIVERHRAEIAAREEGGAPAGEAERIAAGNTMRRLEEEKAQAVKVANELKKEQNKLEKEAAGIYNAVRTPLEVYIDAMERLVLLKDSAMLSSETFNRATEAEAEKYKEALERMKKDTGELNEFQIQAFRNMESAGADFFRSLRTGSDDWLDNFMDMIGRMVDEWLAAQAMMALFGEDYGSGGELGGVVGAVVTGLTASTGTAAVMHSGGIVGDSGVSMAVNPAIFDTAPRLHDGLASDEFPAILQKGEEVIPKGGSKGGDTVINQSFQIDARGADKGVDAKIRQSVEEGATQGYNRVLKDVYSRGPIYKGAKK